ncbi:MAG: ATP-binding protein [Pseudomonadota bacterium]
MDWFGKSLNRKFTLATISGFLVSSLVFLGLFLLFYQSELQRERAQAAREVNQLLQSSLENAMLKRDLEGLVFIVNSLGKQPNIGGVMIADPAGKVRYSTNAERVNLVLDKALIHSADARTHFMQDEQGVEVLRSINPVHNKPQCQECHGPMEKNPVNGILVVDYDASSIRHKARKTTLMLMGAGALIVIINLLGGWWFIRRFILQPVESLSAASHSLASGKLDTRVELPGKDELSLLGHTFNQMAVNLHSSMRKLEEGRAFLQAMVDAIPDGLRIIDENYNMLLVNHAFAKQTGYPDKQWVGEKCYKAAHDLDAPCPAELVTCPFKEIQREGKPVKLVHRHTRSNGDGGDSIDVEIYAAPMTIISEGKEMTLMVESIRDLAQEVRFTHEQRLSELGRLAAGVAHEIYNPLSAMKLALHSMTDLFDTEKKSEEIGNYLDVVEEEMDQCIKITDRLLHLSAAPVDQQQLVDIQPVVKDILSLVKWDADEASIELIESFPEQPLRVFASESEMRMLVLNLVQNAFHAMPSGGSLQITGSIEESEVVVRFKDSGVGIPEDHLPRLFMPFFSRRADGVEGTGLGLPISRSIVESFDGTLEVESELGRGSCFIVRLPEASVERLTS